MPKPPEKQEGFIDAEIDAKYHTITGHAGLAVREDAPLAAPQRMQSLLDNLILAARDKEFDVDKLERLLRMKADAEFNSAYADFQSACPLVRKSRTANIVTKTGVKYSYNYAPLDAIAMHVDPYLAPNGLSYDWDSKVHPQHAGILEVTCTLRHKSGGSMSRTFPVPTESVAGMTPQQKFGAAVTFGQRRSLELVLGLSTTQDDTDGAGDPQAADAERITEQQVCDLNDLIIQIGQDSAERRARWLAWIKADSLANIRAEDFDRLWNALTEAGKRAGRIK